MHGGRAGTGYQAYKFGTELSLVHGVALAGFCCTLRTGAAMQHFQMISFRHTTADLSKHNLHCIGVRIRDSRLTRSSTSSPNTRVNGTNLHFFFHSKDSRTSIAVNVALLSGARSLACCICLESVFPKRTPAHTHAHTRTQYGCARRRWPRCGPARQIGSAGSGGTSACQS
jgi:hypothetical protein